MNKFFAVLALLTTIVRFTANGQEAIRPERSFFSNVGLSVNAGLTGIGATVSTPLGKHFNLRAGFGTIPYTYKYTAKVLILDLSEKLEEYGYGDVQIDPSIDIETYLKMKLNVPAAHFLVDYTPFKEGLGAFHITVGLYTGSSNLVHMSGKPNQDRMQQAIDAAKNEIYEQYPNAIGSLDIDVHDFLLDIGSEGIFLNERGAVDAYAKVNPVRPYFGIGWGNAIPKKRVGFRFDIGALYQGKPEIISPNIDRNMRNEINDNDDLNKVLRSAKFWPQISFQVTVRLLKDK